VSLSPISRLVNRRVIPRRDRGDRADDSEIGGAFGSKPLYRNLGYFSTICLLRVHVLLGDPTCKSPHPLQDTQLMCSGITDNGEC